MKLIPWLKYRLFSTIFEVFYGNYSASSYIFPLYQCFPIPVVSWVIHYIFTAELLSSRHDYLIVLLPNLTPSRYYSSTYKGGISYKRGYILPSQVIWLVHQQEEPRAASSTWVLPSTGLTLISTGKWYFVIFWVWGIVWSHSISNSV